MKHTIKITSIVIFIYDYFSKVTTLDFCHDNFLLRVNMSSYYIVLLFGILISVQLSLGRIHLAFKQNFIGGIDLPLITAFVGGKCLILTQIIIGGIDFAIN